MNDNKKAVATAAVSAVRVSQIQNETALFRDLAPALVERFGPIFFPCGGEKGKTPLEKWRLEPITAERIEHWREKHPYANIGMALGNGIACIDVDINDEDASNAVWNQIVAATDGLGVVYPRTREGSARWAALIKVDGPMQKGVLTFTEHGSGQGSRAIEYLCDGQFVVIAGWHDSGNDCQWLEGAPWETDPDDLASFKVGDVRELIASLGDAVVEQCGWVVGSNGVGGCAAEMTGNGGAEYMPTGKMQELEADDIRKIYEPYVFTSTHYDHGITDTDGLLTKFEREKGDGKSKGYRDVAWEIASIAKFHNDEGQELAFEILHTNGVHDDESYLDGSKLREKIATAFKDFGTREQAWTMASRLWINKHLDDVRAKIAARKLSREKRTDYLEKLDAAGTAKDEEAILELEDTISHDAELSATDREDVVGPAFRKVYNATVPGAALTDSKVKKRLKHKQESGGTEGNSQQSDDVSDWELGTALINEALSDEHEHFKDQHGAYYIEFEEGKAMPVLSTRFVSWVLRQARKYKHVGCKTLGENVALNVEAELEVRKLDALPVERRHHQTGTGRPDDPYRLYIDMSDDDGQVVCISSEIRKVNMADAPVKFIPGAFPGTITEPDERATGSLRKRVNRFWYHMPVPEAGHMQFLGTLVNAFFTQINQPILCLHDTEGGTAKSPTLYRWRQLLDPKTVDLPAAPSTVKGFMRLMGGNTCVAFDDVAKNGLPSAWQKKLNGYSTGRTDETPTLYKTEGMTVLNTPGALGVSTNHREIFTNPETRRRVVFIEFMALGDKRRDEDLANTEFAAEVDALRWTLFELVSEVIKTLPTISDRRGHRFETYARIVNALHKIMRVPGSLIETVEAQAQDSLGGFMDANPFVMDAIAYILSEYDDTREVDISAGRLLAVVRARAKAAGVVNMGEGYPENGTDAKAALTSDSKAISLIGLDVSEPELQTKRTKKYPEGNQVPPKDNGGNKMRLTLNDNAPSRAETEYSVIDDVGRMLREGITVPPSTMAEYEQAQYDEL